MKSRLGNYKAAVVFTRQKEDPLLPGLETFINGPILSVPSRPPENSRIHLVDYQFAALGLTFRPPPLLKPPPSANDRVEQILSRHGLSDKSYLLIHPGSGGRHKNWPIDHWTGLAHRFSVEMSRPVAFTLGPADEHLRPGLAGFQTILTGLPLPVLAVLLARAGAYAGNDSGVSHLAAALGQSTTVVFGPTRPENWAPRGPRVNTIRLAQNGPEDERFSLAGNRPRL